MQEPILNKRTSLALDGAEFLGIFRRLPRVLTNRIRNAPGQGGDCGVREKNLFPTHGKQPLTFVFVRVEVHKKGGARDGKTLYLAGSPAVLAGWESPGSASFVETVICR